MRGGDLYTQGMTGGGAGALPPAGWYDDGSGSQRWWDGTQWSNHYAPDAPAKTVAEPARQGSRVLVIVGIVGTILAGIIGSSSSGLGGFLVGVSLPILITAVIGLARRRRTWLRLGQGGLVAATAITAAVLMVTGVTSAGIAAVQNTANASDATGIAATMSPSPRPSVTPTPHPTRTATPTPTPSPAVSPSTAANPAGNQVAINVLATLVVQPASSGSGYDRVGEFGQSWIDVDHNGCDTRDDILARDLTAVAKDGACTVQSGVLADPYTGETISFTRGVETSRAVQIDHVVALGDAWATGAAQLTQDQRISLANDPLNLLAVDGPTNEAKSDDDASAWLPPNTGYALPVTTAPRRNSAGGTRG